MTIDLSRQYEPMKTLEQWLQHCEQLHAQKIDLGLDRIQAVMQGMDLSFDCPVFTVAGTNGKGSTCAMLEAVLLAAGFETGMYTSPHLMHFEERCRIKGEIVQAEQLLPGFEAVEQARAGISLTYFEFTTLAILHTLAQASLDALILEVGMGGRLDAVNAIDPDCAIITAIDLDHTEVLGETRAQIAMEQAGILRANKPAVIVDPVPPKNLLDYAQELGVDLWLLGRDFNYRSNNPQQWDWAGRNRRYHGMAYPALRGANQLINASGALAALTTQRQRLPVTAQAVRIGLSHVELPGRFQIVPGQPSLILDVAHNPHSAAALALNLESMKFHQGTHAIFGAMRDKDVDKILAFMDAEVDYWYFCDLPVERALSAAELKKHWQSVSANEKATAELFDSPMQALRAAEKNALLTDRIVCFGSFYTVGGVLEDGVPRLVPGGYRARSGDDKATYSVSRSKKKD